MTAPGGEDDRVRDTAPGGTGRRNSARRDSTIGLICAVLGIFIFQLVLGVVAIVFGHRARRAGSGLGTAAFVIGIIDVVLGVLSLASWHSTGLMSV
jgi:hypothetical protein